MLRILQKKQVWEKNANESFKMTEARVFLPASVEDICFLKMINWRLFSVSYWITIS